MATKYEKETARNILKAACKRALQEGLTRAEALEVTATELEAKHA